MGHSAKIEFIDLEKNLAVSQIFVGRSVAIQVTGLRAKEGVTLQCGNALFKSEAVFLADKKGTINLAAQAPLKGSYSGVDIDGMFWSRSQDPSVSENTPPGPFICKALIQGSLVATAQLEKLMLLPGTISSRLTLANNGFEGLFSVPKGAGPFPTLLVLGGSEGGLDNFSSAYFASLGYATLTVAYHGMPGLPPYINQVPLEYFKKSIDWLKEQPTVDGHRLAVYGVSRGGELALVLAATYPDEFKAVIANEASGVIWSGDYDPKTGKSLSSWTYQGQDQPSLSFLNVIPDQEKLPDGRDIISYSKCFLSALTNKPAAEAATIAVEKIRAPILFLGGSEDKVWPSCVLNEIANQRRRQFAVQYSDSYHCYPDAGHTIGVPGSPLMDLTFFHPVFKEFWSVGGTPAGNAKAQRDGWTEVLNFLARELKY